MKFKFVLNDLIMCYKIVNLLVHIRQPEHFTFVEAEHIRYTRQTTAIINNVDKTLIRERSHMTSAAEGGGGFEMLTVADKGGGEGV